MAYLQLLLVLCTVLNSIFYLNARFVAIPASTSNLKAVLKQPLELKCQYDGNDDNGQFTGWYKDDIPISSEKPGHYVVKNEGKESILIIKIFVKADAEVKAWTVNTDKPSNGGRPACAFGPIQLKPSPQGIETDRPNEKVESAHGSVRRNEDESIQLKCIIDPADVTSRNGPQWQFSKDDKSFTDLPAGVNVRNGEIVIDQVKKAQRGYYRCTLNDVEFTVLLRVKDRLAALWPFIGIVGVVLVLVIVILIFEKRQKSNKKTTAKDDDEQDQANDPLVRTTTKASDNDSKKRAVKA